MSDKELFEKYHFKTKFTDDELQQLVYLMHKYVDSSFVYKACCKQDATITALKSKLYGWYTENKNSFDIKEAVKANSKNKNGK